MSTTNTTTATEDMEEFIAEHIPDSDFVPALLAEKVVAELHESSEKLLDAWLHENEVRFVTDTITSRLRQELGGRFDGPVPAPSARPRTRPRLATPPLSGISLCATRSLMITRAGRWET